MAGSDEKPDVVKPSGIPKDDSDVIFMVEGRPIHAHKLILSLASPVFKAMFSRDFKELHSNKIDLPDKKYDDVVEFLQWIYPNCPRVFTGEAVYRLLPLADEYQMECLKAECEEYLLPILNKENGSSQPEFLLRHLYIAERYSLHKVSELAIELCGPIPTWDIETAPSYEKVDDHVRWKLMQCRAMTLEQNQSKLYEDICNLEHLVRRVGSIETDLSVKCPFCSVADLLGHKSGLAKSHPLSCKRCIGKYQGAMNNLREPSSGIRKAPNNILGRRNRPK